MSVQDDFYPGSARLKRSAGGEVIDVPSDEPEEWETMGREFLGPNHSRITLYSVGALAKALNRDPLTVRRWERNGFLPKPSLRTDSSSFRGRRRVYTRRQIAGLQIIAEEEGLLSAKRVHVGRTQFTKRALKLFAELEAADLEATDG